MTDPDPRFASVGLDGDDDVVVCRCEEVHLSELLHALAQGYDAPETMKRATRVSMGACQGRVCRPIYAALWRAWSAAPEGGDSVSTEVGHVGVDPDSRASLPIRPGLDLPGSRPPVRPIRLADLAELDPPEEEPTPSQGNR
jgi:hypothetical protein